MNSQQGAEIRNRHFTVWLGPFLAAQQGIEIQFGAARIADRFRMRKSITNNPCMIVVASKNVVGARSGVGMLRDNP